jgi:hypothetical protein
MRAEDVRRVLRRQPFRPFRLCESDGTVYDILHPEQTLVGASTVLVDTLLFASAQAPPADEAQDYVTISLLHITRLDPIRPPAAGDG